MLLLQSGQAQSADNKICYCFTQPVSSGFMTGTKAVYGTVGLFLTRDLLLTPNQSQPVKFTVPLLPVKADCQPSYTLYVADERGVKISEITKQSNEFSYTFADCNKTYEVRLLATARTTTGSAGNCTRSVFIKVKPVCNTVVCECFQQKGSKPSLASGDLNLAGSMDCLATQSNQRRYVLRFGIINKTNCMLNIESITVHGQTISVPAFNTAPLAETKGVSLGFSTPMHLAPPADSKVSALVRYSLNGKICSVTMDFPYKACN
ncbi:MAG TPA: hypothetical protein PKE07_13705 [Lacibacter sp.]|nr:hypothetical protein [Lacibacter sp.]HMO88547.1 hypothetical protein [Lacibacter sp.]